MIKWRQKMRTWLKEIAEATIKKEQEEQQREKEEASSGDDDEEEEEKKGDDDDDDEEEEEEDADDEDEGDGLDAALKAAAAAERAKQKRQRRKRLKMKDKMRERLSHQLDAPQGLLDDANRSLFNLRAIRTDDQLTAITEGEIDDDALEAGLPQNVPYEPKIKPIPQYKFEMSKEDYLAALEDELEDDYSKHLERKNVRFRHVRHGNKSTTIMGSVTEDGKTVITSEKTKELRKRADKTLQQRLEGSATSNPNDSNDDDHDDDSDSEQTNTPLVRVPVEGGETVAASQWLETTGIADMDLAQDIDFGTDDEDEDEQEGEDKNGQEEIEAASREDDNHEQGKTARGSNKAKRKAAAAAGGDGAREGDDAAAAVTPKLTPTQKLIQLQQEKWANELGLELHAEDLENLSDVTDSESDEGEDSDNDGREVIARKSGGKKGKGDKDKSAGSAAEPKVPATSAPKLTLLSAKDKKRGKKSKQDAGDADGEESEPMPTAADAIREAAQVLRGGSNGGSNSEEEAKAAALAAKRAADPWFDEESDDEDQKGKKKPGKKKAKVAKGDNAFEEVPIEQPAAVKAGLDAEGLAIATEMVVKNRRRAIIDDAYNRYAFNDGELPMWFADEEKKHKKPMKPMTKEMVQQIREYERELNARPIKKVMEAKAKKKYRLLKAMTRVSQQVTAIADNETLTEREKVRQIEQLYKKLRVQRNEHTRTKLVVAKRRNAAKAPKRPKGLKGRYKMVDRRMLADQRGEKAAHRRRKFKEKKKHRS